MLSQSELKSIEAAYRKDEPHNRLFAAYILELCNSFRERNPKIARIIFSREPLIKTLESVTKKIEDRRTVKPNPDPKYNYASLNDLVAFSVLCPFESDIAEFTRYLRKAFDVAEPTDKEALRDHEDGHRGYHFTVSARVEELEKYPDFEDLKCEIQVKTILAEAFDAKSHDLAYKPGQFDVGPELKKQFSLLASGLRAIDGQSEFLKALIVREQKELDLRRNALLRRYLSQPETMQAGLQLGIDLTADPAPAFNQVATALRKSKVVDPALCKFAALCALKYENEALAKIALRQADKLMQSEPDSVRTTLLGGYVYWILGRYDTAIEITRGAMQTGKDDEVSREWARQARNNFIYFVCDWNLFRKVRHEALFTEAAAYVEEITANHDIREHEADTVGLFGILFGDFAQIEEGRELLKRSKKTRQPGEDAEIYQQFYNLHNFIALSRLARLAKQIFDEPIF